MDTRAAYLEKAVDCRKKAAKAAPIALVKHFQAEEARWLALAEAAGKPKDE
ncbi:MAG: hypothetical protein JSR86_02545 [Proteobacteria bacterium]|jgi:hypothetical protein|nr:hypothetical protein [Pseudomonadota bacterium]